MYRASAINAVVYMACLGCLCGAFGFTPAPYERERGEVNQLWQKTLDSQGREAAIRELSELVADRDQDTVLRWKAVEKLVAVQAIAATNLLKMVADTTPTQRPHADKDPYATDTTNRINLQDGARLAYYQLLLAAANTPEKKYQVLTTALLARESTTVAEWAGEEMVLRKEERGLVFIRTHRTDISDDESVDILRRKFQVMKSDTDVNDALIKVIKRKHSQLEGLSALEKARFRNWAQNLLRVRLGKPADWDYEIEEMRNEKGKKERKATPRAAEGQKGQP